MKIKQKTAIGYIRLKLKLLALVSKRKAAATAFRLFCTPYLPKLKKVPAIFKQAEQLTFTMNGKAIRGYRWNHSHPDKILIIHGFNSQAYKFSRYVELLLNKNYEVLAFDAPAHGNSEGKTANAQEYANMIVEVINRYGPVNGFIAHSFGGTALSVALEETQPGSDIKVVFIAPATETTTTLNSAMDFLGVKDKAVKAQIHQIAFEISGKHIEWFSMKRMMPHIHARILWIHDVNDESTPVEDALDVQKESLPNIEFVITKGLGHNRIYHDQDVRERIVNFLCPPKPSLKGGL
jgi:pimeloyl-ACP methyl ester carboxylesterase